MAAKYGLIIDRAFSAPFRDAFLAVAKEAGFEATVKLAAPGTKVWEVQKDDIYISLHTSSHEKGKEKLDIQGTGFDLTPLVSMALVQMITEILVTFLEPMLPFQREELKAGLIKLMTDLGLSVDVGHG